MDDADDADAAYALRTPAVQRRDTITRQLQREILGEIAADRTENEAEEGPTMPEMSWLTEQEGKTEEDDPDSDSRRHTLSPSNASLLQDAKALDAAISRRDTVSPEALKAVLKAALLEQNNNSPLKKTNDLEQAQLQQLTESSPVRKEQRTSPERRKSSSINNTGDSFTDSMFAPNLMEMDTVRRPTLDPSEAASVVAALQLEASSLELEFDSDDNQAKEEEKQVTNTKTQTPSKERNKSPVESDISPSPAKEPESRKSPSPAKNSPDRRETLNPNDILQMHEDSSQQQDPRRQTIDDNGLLEVTAKLQSPAKKPPSPVKRTKSKRNSPDRRETLDPSDVLHLHEDSSQQQDPRRQTIDDNGLLEVTRDLGSSLAADNDSAPKRREEASRKRVHVSDPQIESPEKRSRLRDNGDESMELTMIDSPPQADIISNSRSPSPKDRRRTGDDNQSFAEDLPPSRIPEPSLFSPPPGGSEIRTPLKGILSARKKRKNAEGAAQTTPNKSVNFGPSQSAEFNHGSPSTSMTPMCARDASRLFPLDPPDEVPDDAETSLNSSILSEADSLDDEETKEDVQQRMFPVKKSGFDLLQERKSAPKSTDKSRRRQSMRGYSPLDSQTETRRRRRQTINGAHQVSSKAALVTNPFAKKPAASLQSPSSNNPFLRHNNSSLRSIDIHDTSQMPYADSSASSDAGEDMEITGDYSILLARDNGVSRQQSASSGIAGAPREDDTAEFSLGHLLAESAVYELTKSAPEPDLNDLPGSLGDLANEVIDDVSSSQGSQVVDSSRRLNDQDSALGPIQEVDETMGSSWGQSMMSIDSDDSDAESRKSLSVNLSLTFDRVSADDDASQPVSEAVSVSLITMEELLSSVALAEDSALVDTEDPFFGDDADSSADQMAKDVKIACAYDTCLELVGRRAGDIVSWSAELAEDLSILQQVNAPAFFSSENLDDAGREAIRELYATECMVARSGWYQLQAQTEKQLTNSLSQGAEALVNDVKTLQGSVATEMLKRQNELAAITEMIDREEQMGLLLDAIEEQQGAHDEYVTAVQVLEKECSSLSLEDSVLLSRLKVLEGRAAELEPVTSAAASRFEQEVLATEEMLAIQESMSVWKIIEATATQLSLSAHFEDVLFDVEICVDVQLGSPSTGSTSTCFKTNEFLKRGKHSTYLSSEGDAVLVLQRLLLDTHYIARIADESEHENGNDRRVCSKLQVVECFITRSFRLLKELRELSTHFAMRFNEDDSTLWVDFLQFPSTASHVNAEGAQFSVGFSLLPVFPYTDYQTAVRVSHGQISTQDITEEIGLVFTQAPQYFTRVCRRLHDLVR